MNLKEEAKRRDGCIELRKCRATGKLVGLYRSGEAGLEEDAEGKYTTVCEEHGTLVSHRTLAVARSWLADPAGWCDECREIEKGNNLNG